jgi:hypothetical protein
MAKSVPLTSMGQPYGEEIGFEVDSAAEKEVIRIAFPYLDLFIVRFRDSQLRISIFWFSARGIWRKFEESSGLYFHRKV